MCSLNTEQSIVSPGAKSLSITFFLKELKTTQCELAIMGRLIYDRRKVEFATGIRINESTWCPKKQESNNSSIINKKLIGIRSMINDAKIMLEQEGNFFTVQDIKKMVFDGVKGKPTVLSYCIRPNQQTSTYRFNKSNQDNSYYRIKTI